MSKIFIVCSLLIVATLNVANADFGRPGDNRPNRPGEGRPGDNRPTRPGEGRPGDNRPPVGRVEFRVVDTFKVQKIVETSNTVRVNVGNVVAVKVIARNNDVEITEARALLDDGREIYMDRITGGLGRDRALTYTLEGRGVRVRSITIRALTRGLIGGRAELEVSVGSLQ